MSFSQLRPLRGLAISLVLTDQRGLALLQQVESERDGFAADRGAQAHDSLVEAGHAPKAGLCELVSLDISLARELGVWPLAPLLR